MSVRIAGMGLVTPLGCGVDNVWNRLLRGDESSAQIISRSEGTKTYQAFLVPNEALENMPTHPRLRRASVISRFAAAAGLDAIAQAKSMNFKIDMARLGLVFAVSNGGVVYTKRFYHAIVESGAQSASPLLFPETVFNAPASHLAAILGVNGASYTIVGDGAVGVLGVKMANDLLDTGTVDYCLVVAAEEADWLLCDAYHRWRLVKSSPPVELFSNPPRGTILSEGAGAVLIGREGRIKVDSIEAGGNFLHQRNSTEIVNRILLELRYEGAFVVASANGTFVDLAEAGAIRKQVPDSIVYSAKPALGESVGASALWQVIIAAQALAEKQLPPMLHVADNAGLRFPGAPNRTGSSAIVSSCGLNQQAAGLRLSI